MPARPRPSVSRRVRDRLRPRSLRTRLIVVMVALLAAVCLVIGVVSQVALRGFLIGQLDDQLTAASGRASAFVQPPHPGPRDPPHRDPHHQRFPPGQAAGTLTARIVDGKVRFGAVLDDSGTPRTLTAAQSATVTRLPSGGRATSGDLGGLGEYRLVAVRTPSGAVQVTGLPLNGVNETLYRLALIEAIVAAIALVTAGVMGTVVIRLTLRPLHRVATTAGRVTELPLDRGDVALAVRGPDADTDTRTEVGRVGAALNRMLGHVTDALNARQASETRVRRFVADASHELRTPLAAIRGYAEVTRRRRAEAPPDLAHAMRRVESEAVRMTALVDDLLLLAKLDSGRPLAREPVDLSQLTVDAVSDAHAAGPGHRWRLDLPEEPVVVTGDAARLHQVLANLLANARTHTPEGTTVTTTLTTRPQPNPTALPPTTDPHPEDPGDLDDAQRPTAHPPGSGTPINDRPPAPPRPSVDVSGATGGAAGGGRVVLSVADDGPGIAAGLLPEIFERFARGDASRTRSGSGGTGLGLAIVAAVVESHHGTVTAGSVPGNTTFTITLPLDAPAGADPPITTSPS